MRLGVDARILAYPKCGISTYVRNLTRHLLDLDESLEVFLFSDTGFHSQHNDILKFSRVQGVVFASAKREKRRWAQKFLPAQLKKYNIDIHHATWNNAVPFRRNCPCILTIHDLAPWVLGQGFRHIRKEAKYKLKHFICAHLADMIITDSDKVKEDISRICWVRKKKIRTVHLGIEEEFKTEINDQTVKGILGKYNLKGRSYLIDSAGISHPRRNAIYALEGFEKFLKKTDSDFYLIYTGEIDENNKEYKYLRQRIQELKLEDRVIFTGWISTQELKVLISGAVISIIPSLYEGFGLPVLEAFASLTPVITTDRGSLPEVAGDASVVVDPFNYEDLAGKIEALVNNQDLRRSLTLKGRERLAYFDWKKTAFNTLNLYKSLLGNRKRN